MKYTTRGLLGKMVVGDDEEDVQLNLKKVTKADMKQAADFATKWWLQQYVNLLSCFELDGELGLYASLGTFTGTKTEYGAEINAVAETGDLQAIQWGFFKLNCIAFITLYEKGAFKRLQLVDPLPEKARAELEQMRHVLVPQMRVVKSAEAAAKDRAAELREFADRYNHLSAADVLKYSRRATNPEADVFLANVADAEKAGLIFSVTEHVTHRDRSGEK